VANAAALEPVPAIAAAHGASAGQVALSGVHQRAAVHGCTVVPVPGIRKAGRVRENTAATRLVLDPTELDPTELDPAELDLLEPLADQVMGEGGY
jgi:aryl-alcohol dehydrogenase-like predicted oxidoreductase